MLRTAKEKIVEVGSKVVSYLQETFQGFKRGIEDNLDEEEIEICEMSPRKRQKREEVNQNAPNGLQPLPNHLDAVKLNESVNQQNHSSKESKNTSNIEKPEVSTPKNESSENVVNSHGYTFQLGPSTSSAEKLQRKRLSSPVLYSRSFSSRLNESRRNGSLSYTPLHDKFFGSSTRRLQRSVSNHSLTGSALGSLSQSTVNECFRMDEKETYSQLLERCGCQSMQASFPRIAHPETAKSPAVIKVSPVPVIDVEKELFQNSPSVSLKTPIRINTLEEALEKYSIFHVDFVRDLNKRYGRAERERQNQLKQEEIKKQMLEENRQKLTKHFEDQFRKEISKVPGALLEEKELVTLPEITKEMETVIQKALTNSSSKICEVFDVTITKQDLATLCGLNWLNDQIINCYFTMIMERSKKDCSLPKVYSCNTFFFPKLMQSGHSSLKRWTRKVDIFAHDFVLVPVHLGIHWCAAVVSMKEKCIRYFDSMGSQNQRCLEALLQYLRDESLDKKKTPLDVSDWKLECAKNIPQQKNGSDCGVFACKFAEYSSRRAAFTFTQENMPYFRKRMIYEIVTQKLIHP